MPPSSTPALWMLVTDSAEPAAGVGAVIATGADIKGGVKAQVLPGFSLSHFFRVCTSPQPPLILLPAALFVAALAFDHKGLKPGL